MKKPIIALITGASGRLGHLLAEKIIADGGRVIKIDKTVAPGSIELDISRGHVLLATLIKDTQPNFIFHCAAAIPTSETAVQFHDNVMMSVHLTEAVGALPTKERPVFVNISSASELGRVPSEVKFVAEDFPCAPISPYGVSKYCQTSVVLGASRRFGYRSICARVFNLLPGTIGQPIYTWIDQIRKMKVGRQRAILSTGHLDVVRDFIEVSHEAELILRLAQCDKAYGLINIGSGEAISLRTIVDILKQVSGIPFEVDEGIVPFNGIPRVVADISKLSALIDVPARRAISTVLSEMVD